jgi:hypothetical protein
MRYRQLDANGDYTVGKPFLVNSPETVQQAVLTRLKLWQSEWFVDTSDGTPWIGTSTSPGILGKQFGRDPNVHIKQRILATPGVTGITAYSSSYNGVTRKLTITVTIATQFIGSNGSNQVTFTTNL